MSLPKLLRNKCRACGVDTTRAGYKYCSNLCQRNYEYNSYIKDWKNGKVSGLMSLGLVSRFVKRYLRDKYGDKCCICGWSKINPKTGVVPLVADHIDGNWSNNVESNLRLLCPNCDSLSITFAGLNRGNGRKDRIRSKRAQEARSLFSRKVPS